MRTAGDYMVLRPGTLSPASFPDEPFELYSIPAHDRGGSEVVRGSEIGSSKQLVRPGDVMISKIIPHLRRARVVGPTQGFRQIASSEWIVFRSEDFDPNYLRHFLLSDLFHGQFMNTVAGVGGSLVRARPAQVRRIELPLPTLATQRRIAAILDHADALRAKRRQVLTHLDTLTHSVFHDMFGRSLRERVPIGSFADVGSGSTPPRDNPANYGGTIPWVKTTEVRGSAILAASEYVTELGMRNARLKLFPAGSVVVAMYGQGKTRGQSAVLGVAATTNQACAVIAPNDAFVPEFLQTQLAVAYERLRGEAEGGNQPNLSLGRVAGFEVHLPPMDSQRDFAARAARITAQRAAVTRALASDNELFASLQSRAFRGEL